MPWAIVTAVAVLVLVLSEWQQWKMAMWLSKPVASSGFVLFAIAMGATSQGYGRVVLLALALCLAGDLFLIPRTQTTFLVGIACFLAGHVAYAVAFLLRGFDWFWATVALVLLAPTAWFVWNWLGEHVTGRMRGPVAAYILSIMTMVITAAGTCGADVDLRILAGATAFAVSDLFVARDRFIHRSSLNRTIGLPLYYSAQLLIASTVAV